MTQNHQSQVDQSNKPLDIDEHRAALKKKLAIKHAHEDAVREHLSATERMAVDTCAAIVETCKGMIDVEAYPMPHGYQIATTTGLPLVNIGVRKTIEPHTSVSVSVSSPRKKQSNEIYCYSVDAALRIAVGIIAE
jgi:hypothetical protein